MPESSLRWGGWLGALSAGLGVFAYFAGAFLTPLTSKVTTGEAVIPIVLIRGLFVLVALGVALGLAYYSGMRVGRDQLASSAPDGVSLASTGDRLPAVLSGGLVMVIYWLVTRFVGAVIAFPPFTRLSVHDLGVNVIAGLLFVCLGAGLGGIGARTASTSKLRESVIVVTTPRAAGSSSTTGVSPAASEHAASSTD